MARNYIQGRYLVKHKEKYIGNKSPFYRSSWELSFCQFCDNNPSIIQWASESIHIPYRNPMTGRQTIYVPDFFVMYIDKNGRKHGEIIEIKPSVETMAEARSPRQKAFALLNMAKWEAATSWCKQQRLFFRVVTEKDIYHTGGKRK